MLKKLSFKRHCLDFQTFDILEFIRRNQVDQLPFRVHHQKLLLKCPQIVWQGYNLNFVLEIRDAFDKNSIPIKIYVLEPFDYRIGEVLQTE